MRVKVKTRFIKIDRRDEKLFRSYNWFWSGRGLTHVHGFPKGGPVSVRDYLARIIMNAPKGMVVDHVNGDPSDNRRINLRVCTIQQNRMNEKKRPGKTSKYKGVHFHRLRNKYVAQIKVNKKKSYLGIFKSEKEAALVYDDAAKKLFGEFAYLNFR